MDVRLAMALRATDEYEDALATGAPDGDALMLALQAANQRFAVPQDPKDRLPQDY